MDPFVKNELVSGAIGLGTGIGGSLIQTGLGVATAKYNADLQYQYNKKLADDAYNRQLDFWNMQNAYNTPVQQKARLLQAGLNPALMNGGVDSNSAGNLSSVPQANVSSPSGITPNNPAQFLTSIASLSESLSQGQLIDEQTKYWLQQAVGATIENELKQYLLAQGWSETQIKELDRRAMYAAAFPNEDIPDNPYFEMPEFDDPTPAVNKYDEESDVRIAQKGYYNSMKHLNDYQAILVMKDIGTYEERFKYFKDFQDAQVKLFEAEEYAKWQEGYLKSQETIMQQLKNIEEAMFGQQRSSYEASRGQLEAIKLQIDLQKISLDQYLKESELSIDQQNMVQDMQKHLDNLEATYHSIYTKFISSMSGNAVEAFGK